MLTSAGQQEVMHEQGVRLTNKQPTKILQHTMSEACRRDTLCMCSRAFLQTNAHHIYPVFSTDLLCVWVSASHLHIICALHVNNSKPKDEIAQDPIIKKN